MFNISLLSKSIINIQYNGNVVMWIDGSDSNKYSLLRNIAFDTGESEYKAQIIGVDEV